MSELLTEALEKKVRKEKLFKSSPTIYFKLYLECESGAVFLVSFKVEL